MSLPKSFCLFVFALLAGTLSSPPLLSGQASSGTFPPSAFASLHFRNIGPNRGGRSIANGGSAARPDEYWFGATGGGLWKTTDGGLTWRPVTDGQVASASVGAVAVAESNPDVVYIGMGETELRGNILQGDGVYRTTNGGTTWTHLGLAETQAIARIRVNPTNPDIVFVAAFGHPFGRNDERGVYRSKDGGRTWQKVLFRGDSVGAIDLGIDHHDPNVIYASFWEAYRQPWKLSSGGMAGGLFKSTDGGDTWTDITRNPGLPQGLIGKIGVAVSPVDGRRVYAIVESDSGGVFRSDDAGATWTRVNDERKLRQRAFYYSRIYADPVLKDRVYVLNTGLYRSDDGGATFPTQLRGTHGDFHDLWIAPDDNDRLLVSNDGGGAVSVNGGISWTAEHFPTAQPYHVATTSDFPYQVCGAQQDNSTFCVPSNPNDHSFFNAGQGSFGDWLYAVGGGESGYIAPHPTDPNVFYAGSQGALITRYERNTGFLKDVQVYPRFFSGESAESLPERWQWTFPIVFSPLDPRVLYTSSQHLWKSTDEGQSWTQISPDLTAAVDTTLGDSGGPITKDQNGPEIYGTIFTIAPSRFDSSTIWTGSDDGIVALTRDGGATWTRVTPPDLPPFSRISLIDASPHTAGKAYVAAMRYQLDDRAPYIWRTADYGQTWTKIVTGIPGGAFVHAVREDPVREGLLFAGTEHGVYVSFDDGAHWQSLSLNLPDVEVPDLVIEKHDLVIATHGRSMWILDDIDPLRQMTSVAMLAPLHLFQPRDAVRRMNDAVFYYELGAATDSVHIDVLDAQGTIVRQFVRDAGMADSDSAATPTGHAGLNRFAWDLRYPGAATFEGMILWSAHPEIGPYAPPGEYQVRVAANGQVQAQRFRVDKDPRLTRFTDDDLVEQWTLAMQVRDKVSAANNGVATIRSVRSQIDDRVTRADDAAITSDAMRLERSLGDIEGALYQVHNRSNQDPLNFPIKLNNKLAALLRTVETGDGRPTAGSYQVYKELSDELNLQLRRLNILLQNDLARFNQRLARKNLEPIVAAAPKVSMH